MTNPGSEPEADTASDAAGAKAAAKQRAWLRYANATERSLDDALWLPPLLYVAALVSRNSGLAAGALAFWVLGVLAWSQWIPNRVRKRTPPGDSILAMGWLGLGLLGLPLSILVLAVAPDGSRPMFAFPVAFVWSGVFMMIANLYDAPIPSALRRRVIDVGVVAYMGQAFLAGAGAVSMFVRSDLLGPALADFAYVLAPVMLVVAVLLALFGMRLAGDAAAPPSPQWIADEET